MYKCSCCGKIFDEPVKKFAYSEYWGAPAFDDYYESPCCGEWFDEYEEDEESEDEEE